MTKTKTEYHLRIYNPEGELFISRSGTNKKNVMSEYHKFSKELGFKVPRVFDERDTVGDGGYTFKKIKRIAGEK